MEVSTYHNQLLLICFRRRYLNFLLQFRGRSFGCLRRRIRDNRIIIIRGRFVVFKFIRLRAFFFFAWQLFFFRLSALV